MLPFKTKIVEMKLYVPFLFIVILYTVSASAQCPGGDVSFFFSNLEDIDDFITQYPDCTEINGSLEIIQAPVGDVIDLSGLHKLESISNDLSLSGNFDLSGFENLHTVGGSVLIYSNWHITELSGLKNLQTIGGELSLKNNDYLENLSGLENLKTINGNVTINGNNSLKDLTGLNNLSYIGLGLSIRDNLFLKNITGLENLNSIGGSLGISKNNNLTDLNSLENLSQINGFLTIQENKALALLTGLQNITSGIKEIRIKNNSALNSCSIQSICQYLTIGIVSEIENNGAACDSKEKILENCGEVTFPCPIGDISFETQQQIDEFIIDYPDCTEINGKMVIASSTTDPIVNLFGLQNIVNLTRRLEIKGNNALTNLLGLEKLKLIQTTLQISNNSLLSSLEGLESLHSIGGELFLDNNVVLENLSGLENLHSIEGSFILRNNIELKVLQDLKNLEDIKIGINISGNDALINLEGLEKINRLKSNLILHKNNVLTSLSGLQNLRSIDGDLKITYNEALSSLTGIDNIADGIEELVIKENPLLSNCAVESICNFIEGDNIIDIKNNATGCNNIRETLGACCDFIENCAPCGIGKLMLTTQQQVDSFSIAFPDCRSVNDRLTIKSASQNPITNLSGLSKIVHIDSLTIEDNQLLQDLSGFQNLKNISHELIINNNNALLNLKGLDSLITIGDGRFSNSNIYVSISNNDALINLSGLDSLESVLERGDFIVENNNALTSLSNLGDIDFGGANVTGVSLKIIGNDALTDLKGLQNLQGITGLSISDNKSLTSLAGLENLARTGGFSIAENPALTNIDALENYTHNEDLFSIRENTALTNIRGLKNLGSVYRHFTIKDNTSLTSLDGLENLKLVKYILSVTGNSVLNDISSLKNLEEGPLYVEIKNNPQLSECNIENICLVLANGSGDLVENNAEGCNSDAEVLQNCQGFAQIKSIIYYDRNQNKNYDADESILPFGFLGLEPRNTVVGQSLSGDFTTYNVNPGKYTVIFNEAFVPGWELTTDSTTYTFNLIAGESKTAIFGVYPKELLSEMQTYNVSTQCRCFDLSLLTVTTKNAGTTITDGTIWFKVDSRIERITYRNAPDTIINSNHFGWFYNDLLPSHTIENKFNFKVPGPPDFVIGDSLIFESYATFNDDNGFHQSDTTPLKILVKCSYDPNDKLVAPENICYYTLIDETLNYTTRFQNTGNDVAYKVLVTDMLDANFDLNTFQLISSSHPEVLNTTISDGGLVSFEFNEINLPDSATNLIESQGYINYSIKTKSDIRDNTLIENASNIYFDANPPIETNTVKNVMVSTIPNYIWCFDRDGDGLGDPTQMRISCGAKPDGLVADCTDDDDTVVSINSTLYPHLLIYPNPTKGIFKIKGIPFEEATVSLYNSAGLKVEPSVSQNKEALFKYSNLKNGVYYIEIEIDDRIVRRKIVVIQ